MAGATGWISQGVLRFYSMEEDKRSFSIEITKLTIKVGVLGGLLLGGVYIYLQATFITIILAVLAFVFACLYTVFTVELQARFLSKKVITSDIVRLILYFLVPLGLYLMIPTIQPELALFIGVLLSYLGALLMVNDWKIPTFINSNAGEYKEWSKKIWDYGYPLSIWMFLSPTLNTSDRYIINYFLGPTALGQYSAIFDIIFKLFSQLTGPFNNIVQPLLIDNYNSGDKKSFKVIMFRSGLYLIIMFSGIFLIVLLIKHYLIYNYLGFKKDVAMNLEKVVMPLLVSSFFWQISVLLQKILEINKKTKIMVVYMLVSMLCGLCITIYFISEYGYIAASYGMLVSSLIYLSLILINTKRNLWNL